LPLWLIGSLQFFAEMPDLTFLIAKLKMAILRVKIAAGQLLAYDENRETGIDPDKLLIPLMASFAIYDYMIDFYNNQILSM